MDADVRKRAESLRASLIDHGGAEKIAEEINRVILGVTGLFLSDDRVVKNPYPFIHVLAKLTAMTLSPAPEEMKDAAIDLFMVELSDAMSDIDKKEAGQNGSVH